MIFGRAACTLCARHHSFPSTAMWRGQRTLYFPPFSHSLWNNQYLKPWNTWQQQAFSFDATARAPPTSLAKKHEASWSEMLKELQRFVEKHGHARVPEKWPENPPLARWLAYNRTKYRANTLEEEKVKQLEELGMAWNPYEQDWHERYAELLSYKKKHGHCMEFNKKTDRDLGQWAASQRYQYRLYLDGKSSIITAERIELLNKINFEWEPQEAIWMNHYNNLGEFRKEHGHCLVPLEYEGLYRWVEMNRYHYRKMQDGRLPCSMTQERVDLLNKLDFCWDAREAAWLERFSELKEFVDTNGMGQVPPYKTHKSLRLWLSRQIKLYDERQEGKEARLPEERVSKLKSLGFLLE